MTAAKHRYNRRRFNHQVFLMAMAGVVFLLIFAYIPMIGVVIGFKNMDYSLNIMKDLFDKPFVGFSNFVKFVTDAQFKNVMLNTLSLSLLELLFTFPLPILFALLLNELRSRKFKRVVQTSTYFPHFISWVVYGGIVMALLSSDGGFANSVLLQAGLIDKPINFMSRSEYFYAIVIISSAIKGTGWGSVIYVAAISGIDPQIYEAARIDGANRRQNAFLVTLPSIASTITVLLLLAISGILGSGFDRIYMLQNPLNLAKSEVLDTYIYKVGISQRRFSFTTAVGVFRSFLAVLLLSVGNFTSKRLTGNGLF
ncbi:MAG: ABC transporter permease subunit [Oscillospiraceae bacterium]|nr:ABC transporter permease subunit [Oscillospiraceae bacterium]